MIGIEISGDGQSEIGGVEVAGVVGGEIGVGDLPQRFHGA